MSLLTFSPVILFHVKLSNMELESILIYFINDHSWKYHHY